MRVIRSFDKCGKIHRTYNLENNKVTNCRHYYWDGTWEDLNGTNNIECLKVYENEYLIWHHEGGRSIYKLFNNIIDFDEGEITNRRILEYINKILRMEY